MTCIIDKTSTIREIQQAFNVKIVLRHGKHVIQGQDYLIL
jgi:hypothetical protein